MSKHTSITACPCGSGHALAECCLPCIDGTRPAPTAEALMRSRYTAYALQKPGYLIDTWHASTRPSSIDFEPHVQWTRLRILDTAADCVEFVATYKLQGRAHKLHENSRFVFEDGRWFYLDGDLR